MLVAAERKTSDLGFWVYISWHPYIFTILWFSQSIWVLGRKIQMYIYWIQAHYWLLIG